MAAKTLALALVVALALAHVQAQAHVADAAEEPAVVRKNTATKSASPAVNPSAAKPPAAKSTSSPPKPTAAPKASSECFPGDAVATLESGRRVPLTALRVGDRVAVAAGAFSQVFLFTHAERRGLHRFVRIATASGAVLRATPGHYVPVGSAGGLKAAAAVTVGEALHLADGSTSPVVAVSSVAAHGLFNPQTVHGDIIVDGVRASTYTMATHPRFAHAALAPLRAVFEYAGITAGWCNAAAAALSGVAAPRGVSSVA